MTDQLEQRGWVHLLATSRLAWVLVSAAAACGTPTTEDASDAAIDDVVDIAGDVTATAAPPCAADDDCAALSAWDRCLLPARCDLTAAQPRCQLGAARPPCVGGDACSDAVCEPATGACLTTPRPDGTPCDDGQPCTIDAACAKGACTGGSDVCACQSDADCAPLDDDNLCNGKLFCDLSLRYPACKLLPGSIPDCGDGDASDCETLQCDPTSGGCVPAVAPDQTPCSDGDGCSNDDRCVQGACIPGAWVCACQSWADCLAKDDGNPCNGTLYCDVQAASPVCKIHAALIPACDASDGAPCAASTCDPSTGTCVVLPLAATPGCDDGNPCSGGDHCAGGTCLGPVATCPCTADADCASQNPENKCLGTLYCDTSVAGAFVCRLNPATPVLCPVANDTSCLRNRCQPKTGSCAMQPRPEGTACDADGNPCTLGDRCEGGACAAGADVCPCQKDADCGPYDDGDKCNGSLSCDPASMQCRVLPSTVVSCPASGGTACQLHACQPASGTCKLTPRPNGTPCDADGSACTVGDACQSGVCQVGVQACACQQDIDCKKFDDGDLCNGVSYCDKSELPFACKPNPASVVTCSPAGDSACAKATCQPSSGTCSLKAVEDNLPCDDGDPCTPQDHCKNGVCAAAPSICGCGKDADCAWLDDNNLCNGKHKCDKSAAPWACKVDPLSVIACPLVDLPCAAMQCQPASGLCLAVPKPDKPAGTPCVVGSASGKCTKEGVCAK